MKTHDPTLWVTMTLSAGPWLILCFLGNRNIKAPNIHSPTPSFTLSPFQPSPLRRTLQNRSEYIYQEDAPVACLFEASTGCNILLLQSPIESS